MNNSATRWKPRRQVNGFSLMEVVIAMSVMAVGLTGVAALMLRTSTGASETLSADMARALASELEALARLTPGIAVQWANGSEETACVAESGCGSQEVSQRQFINWRQRVERVLPGGHGLVCRDASPEDGDFIEPACDLEGPLVLKIFWRADPGSGIPVNSLYLWLTNA